MSALLPLLLAASLSPVGAVTGKWEARLLPTPDYPVAFGIEIRKKGADLEGALVNGSVTTPFTSVVFDGRELVLSLAHYDATIVSRLKDGRLEGRYERFTVAGMATVPFAAARPGPPRAAAKAAAEVSGTWGFEIGRDRSLGVFRQKGNAVDGTILTTTGDEGAIHGTIEGRSIVLSVFDGVHVYRFDATVEEDGTLTGEFRSRTNPPEPLRARRLNAKDAAAWIPGAFSMVRAKDPAKPFRFAFPDDSGKTVSSDDYAGRPMLVTIMGTWCPNCYDEAPLLVRLEKEWRGKGLAVVELAFEYTDDVARFRRQAARYRERHGAPFPILLAGTTDGVRESGPVSQLEGWEGYPTTLFLDREHRIVAAHSGFDGPATGERHAATEHEFEERVRALVAR